MRTALTIAGSDSGGGAGIQADLKTFAARGVYGASVLTAVTAQNTLGVSAVLELPPDLVEAQLDAVLGDLGADAAKTGMLSSQPLIEAVAGRLRRWGVGRLVVDPVMVAKSGDRLLREDAEGALRALLLPLALVVMPNLPEAEALSGRPATDRAGMEEAARRIAALGPRYVVVKGGHSEGAPVDLLFDGERFEELAAERIPGRNTHGTGCTFSAAIAAELAKGAGVREAAAEAKRYITEAIRQAPGIGGGHGPLNHFPSPAPASMGRGL
jgi:hydroxymethylpyrimidine/phosphomethylpyrimidine kinase